MTKWEKLNSELADARHYAADMKERVAELEAQAAAVPVAALHRYFAFSSVGNSIANGVYPYDDALADIQAVATWLLRPEVQP